MSWLKSKYLLLPVLTAFFLILSWKTISSYLNLSFSFHNLGLALLPFIVYVREKGNYSYRYGILALTGLIFHYFTPTPFFIFLSLCFAIFFVIESFYGKLNTLAPVMIILITPLTKYFFDVFGFPIRLKITELATYFLNLLGIVSHHTGNLIVANGVSFSVDPSCMGLKMVITSLLICLMIISLLERENKKELKLFVSGLILLAVIAFIVLTNFYRIIALILFRSMPNTVSHEVIGVVCLFFFTIVPTYIIVKLVVKKVAEPHHYKLVKNNSAVRNVVLLVLVVFFSGTIYTTDKYQDIPQDPLAESIQIGGFKKEILENNVIKLFNENALVYIKPCKGPFRSNHNPYMCWKGSGYELKNVQLKEHGGLKFYTAQLVSENESLQTAWWYDNGKNKTVSQLEWRWDMFRGAEDYRLINITANNHELLLYQMELVLEKSDFLKS